MQVARKNELRAKREQNIFVLGVTMYILISRSLSCLSRLTSLKRDYSYSLKEKKHSLLRACALHTLRQKRISFAAKSSPSRMRMSATRLQSRGWRGISFD